MPAARAILALTARTFDLYGRMARADYLWYLVTSTAVGMITVVFSIFLFGKPTVAIVAIIVLFTMLVTLMFLLHTMGLLLFSSQSGFYEYGPKTVDVSQ